LVSSLLEEAQKKASHPIVCYVSSDIVLPSNFCQTIVSAASLVGKNFLIVGRRHDIQKDGSIKKHGLSALDYWAFKRGMIKDFPPFSMGRRSFDNFLLHECNREGVETIDASEVITIYHQWHEEHDYDSIMNEILVRKNLLLANGRLATLRDCKWKLCEGGLKKKSQILAKLWRARKRLLEFLGA
jgi:hypothetical protein